MRSIAKESGFKTVLPCILCAVQAKLSFSGNCMAVIKSFWDEGFFDVLKRNSIFLIGVIGRLGHLLFKVAEFFFRRSFPDFSC